VITGGADFNHSEIVMASSQLKKDGVQIRVFDYEKLGHQMPSPDQFLEAITWADEPYQEIAKREDAAAKAMLERYIQKFGPGSPGDDKARAELVKVTEAGPWSEAAWKAVDLLRATK
jgi:acetyl esterase/lipase